MPIPLLPPGAVNNNVSTQTYPAAQPLHVSDVVQARREEVDLHGLFVKEAISYVSRAVLEAFVRGDREVRFIVGRGFFSEDGEPKLRPAVAKLMIR
jgi:DNA-nicking Smr family endonuclease